MAHPARRPGATGAAQQEHAPEDAEHGDEERHHQGLHGAEIGDQAVVEDEGHARAEDPKRQHGKPRDDRDGRGHRRPRREWSERTRRDEAGFTAESALEGASFRCTLVKTLDHP